MKDLSPSDLKTNLHSKRANLYYLEHCRVMQKDGRVLYPTEADKEGFQCEIEARKRTMECKSSARVSRNVRQLLPFWQQVRTEGGEHGEG